MSDEKKSATADAQDFAGDEGAAILGMRLFDSEVRTKLDVATDVVELTGGHSSLVVLAFLSALTSWIAKAYDAQYAVDALRMIATAAEQGELYDENEKPQQRPCAS